MVCYVWLFFQEQHNLLYKYNESLKDASLTRIACNIVFKSLLNENLFPVTSPPNLRTPSPNTGIFMAVTATKCEKINTQKIKDIEPYGINHKTFWTCNPKNYMKAIRNCSHSHNNLINQLIRVILVILHPKLILK